MPYIKPEDRPKLDAPLNDLIAALAQNQFNAGELNYAFSKVLKAAFLAKPSYATINNLVGVVACVQSEFYRRQAAPYEDRKIVENGDI